MRTTLKEARSESTDGILRYNFLVLGVDERGRCNYRGHNDISILFCIEGEKIRAFSFPRDMIVDIPEKGWWLICNVFPYLTGPGAARWFENYFDIRIDNYIVFDVHAARKMAKRVSRIPLLPEFMKKLSKDYDYIEDWVRHRHKLKLEIARQKRIQAFLDHAYRTVKANKNKLFYAEETRVIGHLIAEFMVKTAVSTDLGYFGVLRILDDFMCADDIEWHIWPGTYAPRNFDYPIFEGMRYCWVSDCKTVADALRRDSKTVNPFNYSRTNFFAMDEGVLDKYYVTTEIPKWKYKRWNHIDKENCK